MNTYPKQRERGGRREVDVLPLSTPIIYHLASGSQPPTILYTSSIHTTVPLPVKHLEIWIWGTGMESSIHLTGHD